MHGLYAKNFPRSVAWKVDQDYSDRLSAAEKEWLSDFNDAFYGADFRAVDSRQAAPELRKAYVRKSPARRAAYVDKNRANRDLYTATDSVGKLTRIPDMPTATARRWEPVTASVATATPPEPAYLDSPARKRVVAAVRENAPDPRGRPSSKEKHRRYLAALRQLERQRRYGETFPEDSADYDPDSPND